MYELVNNDRVIGGINDKSTNAAIDFYSQFVKGKMHTANSRTQKCVSLQKIHPGMFK